MGKLNKDNFRKTIYYLQKNGLKNTLYAIAERLQKKETDAYTYETPREAVLLKQRERVWERPVTFSILVPLYHTPKTYFKEMLESVLHQTYPYFQLVLLDASDANKQKTDEKKSELADLAAAYGDTRVCYYKLAENIGIAENTNAGLEYATGDYIALLDHDDLLTADALYEMAAAIEEGKKKGVKLQLIYTDEDKCNGDATEFYEPHRKQDFNPDLLLTNNYICHFTALKAELFKELKLRGEFNGAQDFDLVLRATDRFWNRQECICHIPKILYHWRCHTASTAANPASKTYAYEAGKRAVEAFAASRGWKVQVKHLKHLGFYRVEYEGDIWKQRPEAGAIGGKLLDKAGKIIGGMMTENGEVVFKGLPGAFSGYMNRAVLTQQAACLDIRCMKINPACYDLLEQKLGISAKQLVLHGDNLQAALENSGLTLTIQEASLQISKTLRDAGYCLIWDPQWCRH